jgi:hypothetical protein
MKKIALSIPSERLIGFTIPDRGRFYVCDHDDVWEIILGSPLSVDLTGHQPYGFARERGDFLGWGRVANDPVLSRGQTEISYDFRPGADSVKVRYRVGEWDGEIEFPTVSGDWFCASLSADGHYLVLAEPYRLDLYEVR